VEQQFFARVTAGLERVAWGEIARRTGATHADFGHRRIDFGFGGPPATLLELRGVDDVYACVARLDGLDHTRASLARLVQKLGPVDVGPALEAIRAVRAIGDRPSFRVTSSHLGRRNYSRYDVEGAAADAIVARLPWRFVPNDPAEEEPTLDLRVLLDDDWALVGLRLGAAPLHRRDYKIAGRPGSLKAPVAYCLCLLAEVAAGDTVLDLACGAGTILAEAATLAPGGTLVGVDIAEGALALAQANLHALGLAPRAVTADLLRAGNWRPAQPLREREREITTLLYHGDALDLPLGEQTVHVVVSNLPWGTQVPVETDLAPVYAGMLHTVERVLKPGGRAVLLTDQPEPLLAALATRAGLRLASTLPISLFGRHPTIYVIQAEA
jgi:23S rRNA G2445 N2-methylase RlmL